MPRTMRGWPADNRRETAPVARTTLLAVPPSEMGQGIARAGGVAWPPGTRVTARRKLWFERLRNAKPGMDLVALAASYRTSYSIVQRWATLFGYAFPDRRCRGGPAEKWDAVDWRLSDSRIARTLGLTRERVRQVRRARGLPPSRPAANRGSVKPSAAHFVPSTGTPGEGREGASPSRSKE